MATDSKSNQAAATNGNSVALRCLDDALAQHGQAKVVAIDLGVSEQTLSKMRGGSQAFGVDRLDALDDDLLKNFLRRYGRARGFRVRFISAAEIDADVLVAVKRVVATMRLRAVRSRAAKAALRSVAAERRRA
jgi:hypothetical protein